MSEPTPLSAQLGQWMTDRGMSQRPVFEPDDAEGWADADLAAQAAEHAHSVATRRWHQAVPQEFHGVHLERDFRSAPWLTSAIAWSQTVGGNVLIVGPVGTGKTHLASAMIQPWCQAGLTVQLISEPWLFDSLRPGGPEDAMAVLAEDVDRLVIDDVGQARVTEWSAERFGMLVDARWSQRRPTVFTTNRDPAQLVAHVGARAYSRMTGGALKIALTGDDRRRVR